MSRLHHIRLKLVNDNRNFYIREDDASDKRLPGETANEVITPTSYSNSPGRATINFEAIQSCNSIWHFEGVKRIPHVPTLSVRRPGKIWDLFWLLLGGITSTEYSKLDGFLAVRISVRSSLHDYSVVAIIISTTKVKRKSERREHRQTTLLVMNSGEPSA